MIREIYHRAVDVRARPMSRLAALMAVATIVVVISLASSGTAVLLGLRQLP